MNKFIFLLVSFFVYTVCSKADYLNTKTSNQCVYNVTPYQNNKGLCYTKRIDDRSYCSSTLKYSDLIDGYVLVNSDCLLLNDLKLTGFTAENWRYFMGVLAHILGFTMLFLMSYSSYITGRG